jgi:hypothetical protein
MENHEINGRGRDSERFKLSSMPDCNVIFVGLYRNDE